MNPAVWREFETACICCAFQDAWDIAEGEGRQRTLNLFALRHSESRLAWLLLDNPPAFAQTQHALGFQVGCSRENVTRIMQRWRRMKIIRTGMVPVLDRAALQRRFDALERRA
jgi:hypothetical protein